MQLNSNASTWNDVACSIPSLREQQTLGKYKIANFDVFSADLYSRLYDGSSIMSDPPSFDQKWMEVIHDSFQGNTDWSKIVNKTTTDKRLAMVANAQLLEGLIAHYVLPSYISGGITTSDFLPADKLKGLQSKLSQATKFKLSKLAADTKLEIEVAESRYLEYADTVKGQISDKVIQQIIQTTLKVLSGVVEHGSEWGGLPGVYNAAALADKVAAAKGLSTYKSKKIIEHLGKLSMSLGKTKSKKCDRKSGIEYGNSVPDLLADELLKDNDVFSLEYAEEKLMQYSRDGKTSKGPLIVLLDQSGSMDDQRLGKYSYDVWAKAFVMLLGKIAIAQKRQVHLITFDETVIKQMDLTKASATEVCEMLNFSPTGNTDWVAPINAAIEIIKGKNKTAKSVFKHSDIVMITDGAVSNDDDYVKSLERRKKELNFKIQGIFIASQSRYLERFLGQLRMVADSVIHIQHLSDESKLKDVVDII